jgi:hypothetical protein
MKRGNRHILISPSVLSRLVTSTFLRRISGSGNSNMGDGDSTVRLRLCVLSRRCIRFEVARRCMRLRGEDQRASESTNQTVKGTSSLVLSQTSRSVASTFVRHFCGRPLCAYDCTCSWLVRDRAQKHHPMVFLPVDGCHDPTWGNRCQCVTTRGQRGS